MSNGGKTNLKIIVLGAANVGKTSLMKRYCTSTFSYSRKATIGADFMTKAITLNDDQVILQIWDTAGSERFHQNSVGNMFYRGAHGAMLVYDVTSSASFAQLMKWRDEIVEVLGNTDLPVVVVANKIDLRSDETPDNTEVITWCTDNYYGHIETSAKDDIGVAAAMNAISSLAIEKLRSVQESGRSPAVRGAVNSGLEHRDTLTLENRYEQPKSSSCC
jgi:Ras-related protein Rab-7A